ncbi:MAG: hypothetical protein ABIE84_01080 [bacterium]
MQSVSLVKLDYLNVQALRSKTAFRKAVKVGGLAWGDMIRQGLGRREELFRWWSVHNSAYLKYRLGQDNFSIPHFWGLQRACSRSYMAKEQLRTDFYTSYSMAQARRVSEFRGGFNLFDPAAGPSDSLWQPRKEPQLVELSLPYLVKLNRQAEKDPSKIMPAMRYGRLLLEQRLRAGLFDQALYLYCSIYKKNDAIVSVSINLPGVYDTVVGLNGYESVCYRFEVDSTGDRLIGRIFPDFTSAQANRPEDLILDTVRALRADDGSWQAESKSNVIAVGPKANSINQLRRNNVVDVLTKLKSELKSGDVIVLGKYKVKPHGEVELKIANQSIKCCGYTSRAGEKVIGIAVQVGAEKRAYFFLSEDIDLDKLETLDLAKAIIKGGHVIANKSDGTWQVMWSHLSERSHVLAQAKAYAEFLYAEDNGAALFEIDWNVKRPTMKKRRADGSVNTSKRAQLEKRPNGVPLVVSLPDDFSDDSAASTTRQLGNSKLIEFRKKNGEHRVIALGLVVFQVKDGGKTARIVRLDNVASVLKLVSDGVFSLIELRDELQTPYLLNQHFALIKPALRQIGVKLIAQEFDVPSEKKPPPVKASKAKAPKAKAPKTKVPKVTQPKEINSPVSRLSSAEITKATKRAIATLRDPKIDLSLFDIGRELGVSDMTLWNIVNNGRASTKEILTGLQRLVQEHSGSNKLFDNQILRGSMSMDQK